MNIHNHLYVGTLVCLYFKMCESVDAFVRANVRACVCANVLACLLEIKHKDRRLRNCVFSDCVHANVHQRSLQVTKGCMWIIRSFKFSYVLIGVCG